MNAWNIIHIHLFILHGYINKLTIWPAHGHFCSLLFDVILIRLYFWSWTMLWICFLFFAVTTHCYPCQCHFMMLPNHSKPQTEQHLREASCILFVSLLSGWVPCWMLCDFQGLGAILDWLTTSLDLMRELWILLAKWSPTGWLASV